MILDKDRNKGLVPEDGDFGTDFSEPKKGPKKDEKPEIEFSIDAKGARQTKGGSEDYYSEVQRFYTQTLTLFYTIEWQREFFATLFAVIASKMVVAKSPTYH